MLTTPIKRDIYSGTVSTDSYSDSFSDHIEVPFSQYIKNLFLLTKLKQEDDEEIYSEESNEQTSNRHEEITEDTPHNNTLEFYESILYSQLIQEIKLKLSC